MKKFGLLLSVLLLTSFASFGQVNKSIKLNEIMTNNTDNLQDEYGQHHPWVEIVNVSYSTYNIRGMFITTDRSVLDKKMSVPERMKRMSIIPNGDNQTNLNARQHIIYFCNSNPAQGNKHLRVSVDSCKTIWVGLYNGNATELLDSVTIPALAENQSYARAKDGSSEWQIKPYDAVTPGISNYISVNETKIAKLKREDPHGFGISVLAMSIVFFCLALLFVFFTVFGIFMKHRSAAKKVANIQPLKAGVKTVEKTIEISHKTNVILQDGLKTKGIDKETYIAVISLALDQYLNDVHDIESGTITIKDKHTDWNNEYNQMTHFHE